MLPFRLLSDSHSTVGMFFLLIGVFKGTGSHILNAWIKLCISFKWLISSFVWGDFRWFLCGWSVSCWPWMIPNPPHQAVFSIHDVLTLIPEVCSVLTSWVSSFLRGFIPVTNIRNGCSILRNEVANYSMSQGSISFFYGTDFGFACVYANNVLEKKRGGGG